MQVMTADTASRWKVPIALCGLLGTAALVAYYAAPYTFMPLPPPDATAGQVLAFGSQYHNAILWDTWLQAIGSLLSVVFALALVHLAGASSRFAGRLTLLAGGVVLTLALMEGAFALGAVQAGTNGNAEAASTYFALTYTFIHVYLIAPSLFLMLGAALWGTRLLPPAFSYLALGLGILFQVLGVLGLFNATALLVVIFVLIAQELWNVAAAITLLVRPLPPAVLAETA
jgi:hypothetical protein